MDLDPRDFDSRDDERFNSRDTTSREFDLDDDLKRPDDHNRDRDDDARTLGRGPGDSRDSNSERGFDPRDDARWPEREREAFDRASDPRDIFTRHLDLPRGLERERVWDREREYTLRGSESRTLATVGAFRVVSSRDLRDRHDRSLDPRSGDLRHLREQRLVELARVPGSREYAIALTKEGRSLLEHHRDRHQDGRQTFWHGLKREREREHDLQVYRAYERAAERLGERGAHIDRVMLDHELKREYQTWLHERDRDRPDANGRPDRTDEEIQAWAREHELPYFDEEVHFPDLRIEYRDREGREEHEDIEVTTEHSRGALSSSVAQSGFSCYRGSSARVGGGGGRGGRGHRGGLAEELLR
jgi:hypothetical protein